MVNELNEGGIKMAEFGRYLKAVREKKGFGVNQLAMLVGVSPSLISRVENGKRGAPKGGTVNELAKALKVSQIEMFFMAGNHSILQMSPDVEFSEIAYRYMNEEDLSIINKYRKETHQPLLDAKRMMNKELENIVGENIKKLRNEKNIDYKKLATDLGFEPFMIYNIEAGDYRPDPEMITLIADYFNVSADYLLGRTDNPELINYKKNDSESSSSKGDQKEFEMRTNDPLEAQFYKEFKESPDERRKALLAAWEYLKSLEKK